MHGLGMFRDTEKLADISESDSPDSGMSDPGWGKAATMESYSRYARRRILRPGIVALFLIAVLLRLAVFRYSSDDGVTLATPAELNVPADPTTTAEASTDDTDAQGPRFNIPDPKLHFLVSAKEVDLDVCRTLLTSGILGFPNPTILGLEKLHNGTDFGRFPRISHVLAYLQSLRSEQDEELVLLVDGDDIQFQLPLEVLLTRYYSITGAANLGLQASFGRGSAVEGIAQSVIFASDKRCASAATTDEACYPVPPSPAADDVYANYTDTATGPNDWFHYRPKYVNPGFVIGPVVMVRRIFERAEQIAKESGKASALASTSEQAVFAKVYSEQERWRETKRSDHDSDFSRLLSALDTEAGNDSEIMAKLNAKTNYEFGITVDYFSDVGHSTLNSEVGRDSQFIAWVDDDYTTFHEQANDQHRRDGKLDCMVNIPDSPPDELLYAAPPYHLLEFRDSAKGSTYDHAADNTYDGPGWESVPLYAHLCYGSVPVMIHHNGNATQKAKTWEKMWLRQRSNALLQFRREKMERDGLQMDVDDWAEFKKRPGFKAAGGAWTDEGGWYEWNDICPYDRYGSDLFHRDP